jgi:SHS2 domain-containing protein
MSQQPTHFEFLEDVTSDLCFAARGATLPELFASAAEALLDATVERRESIGASELRHLELEEPDVELLLMRFLNELIYLRDAEALLLRPRELVVEANPDRARLVGELTGERLDRVRHAPRADVKAAAPHGLALLRDADGFRATVTLDV